MPAWGWSAAGPPSPVDASPAAGTDAAPELPPIDVPVTFDAHVKTLFRARDRRSMLFAFDLWSYDDVVAHSTDVLDRVRSGSMPPDGRWPAEQVEVFRRWIDGGTPR